MADAARRLGPEWVSFRVRYALEHRVGAIERRSPRRPWPESRPPSRPLPAVVDAEVLREWLTTNVDSERRADLAGRVAALRARRFDVFGTSVHLDSWHHDPISGMRYPADVHWSRAERPGVDVKLVWEPSRFGWAFDLARAELLDPSLGAADLFWDLLDDWCAENPPNAGINWFCGQEASIRLMACVAAASAMVDQLDDDRAGRLQRLAWVTAERVEANIAYARSQRNNHHASEAVGLLTTSLLYPDHERAETWASLGVRHLTEVADRLVLADGGTSQYSTNYHRVFLHDLLWAIRLHEVTARRVPATIRDATARATDFLGAVIDPTSGSGPFFGPDDGARLLPLAAVPHRQLRADLELAHVVLERPSAAMEAAETEPGAWFGRRRSSVAAPQPDPRPWTRSFPAMGVHLLGAGHWRALIRCGSTEFRPTQDDQLHVDLWHQGVNVATDAGTQSYTPAPGQPGPLDRAADHNAPTVGGETHAVRVGRFLWARWPAASACCEADDESAHGSFELRLAGGAVLRRRVTVSASGVEVDDRVDGGEPLRTRWALPEGTGVVTEISGGEARSSTGVVSPGYGSWSACPVLVAEGRRIVTTFSEATA